MLQTIKDSFFILLDRLFMTIDENGSIPKNKLFLKYVHRDRRKSICLSLIIPIKLVRSYKCPETYITYHDAIVYKQVLIKFRFPNETLQKACGYSKYKFNIHSRYSLENI